MHNYQLRAVFAHYMSANYSWKDRLACIENN